MKKSGVEGNAYEGARTHILHCKPCWLSRQELRSGQGCVSFFKLNSRIEALKFPLLSTSSTFKVFCDGNVGATIDSNNPHEYVTSYSYSGNYLIMVN